MSVKDIARGLLFEKLTFVKEKGGVNFLIFDDESKEILENYCTIQESMKACGAQFADKLIKKRQPQPEKDALYLINGNNQESIGQVNRDFSDTQNFHYKNIHFIFTCEFPPERYSVFNRRVVDPHVKTRQEINIHFYKADERVYHFNSPLNLLGLLVGIENQLAPQYLQKAANQLKSLFVTLGDYPIIYYHNQSLFSAKFASLFQQQLENTRKSPKSTYPAMQRLRNRPKLLIIDRSFDCISPLLHEFTYEAMAYDLLDLKGGTYKYNYKNKENVAEEKEVPLNENDSTWMKTRHMHIRDVSDVLRQDFKEFMTKYDAVSKIDRNEKNSSLLEMKRAVKSVNSYQDEKQIYSMHMRMVDECLDKFTARHLVDIGYIEQDLACGVEANGMKSSPGKMKKEVKNLWNEHQDLQEEDRIRIIALLGVCLNIKGNDLLKFQAGAKTPQSYSKGLEKLVNLQNNNYTSIRKPLKKSEYQYDLSRWRPLLYYILEKFLDGKMKWYPKQPDVEGFTGYKATGYQKGRKRDGSKSLKCRKQPSWAAREGKVQVKAETKLGDRFFVYILGGTTYSELREVCKMSKIKERDVTILGCAMFTPKLFMNTVRCVPDK